MVESWSLFIPPMSLVASHPDPVFSDFMLVIRHQPARHWVESSRRDKRNRVAQSHFLYGRITLATLENSFQEARSQGQKQENQVGVCFYRPESVDTGSV